MHDNHFAYAIEKANYIYHYIQINNFEDAQPELKVQNLTQKRGL